jgi:ankyrin repeat protein
MRRRGGDLGAKRPFPGVCFEWRDGAAYSLSGPGCLNLLLSHPRVNVNCTDKDGNTPLWLSTYSSCDEVTKWRDGAAYSLSGPGCLNPDAFSEKPFDSIYRPIGKRLEMVVLLLSHPRVNVNCTDKDGNTPLWLSTYSGPGCLNPDAFSEKPFDSIYRPIGYCLVKR